MSKGNDSRLTLERQARDRDERAATAARSSRSSVRMTVDRARAIQAAADRSGQNQDFKSRAMAAAARDAEDEEEEGA